LGSYHSGKYPWDVDAGKKPSRNGFQSLGGRVVQGLLRFLMHEVGGGPKGCMEGVFRYWDG